MDTTTTIITIIFSVCIVGFAIMAVGGALYGILVWYPAYRRKKVGALKAAGRQGEATILRLPDFDPHPYRRAVFTLVEIILEIRVAGLDPYQVNKRFTIPTHVLDKLEEGKVVPVWVDPKEPRNLDKIVIDIK